MFCFEKEKELPYCSGRYKLNEFGDILTSNGDVIETKIINSRKMIELSWINGLMFYDVAIVVAIVVYNIKLPTVYWNRIEPLFEDGNCLNTNICNISYCFNNSPIEIKEYPGFFYIPYYTSYGISYNGDLVNRITGRIKCWSVTPHVVKKNIKGGYRHSRAKNDTENHSHVTRHRAMGLTFLKYDSNPLKLVINHKNGTPGDDVPNNLEWTTRAKNNQHAYDNGLFPNKTVKFFLKNLNTNTITRYTSIASCAREINRSESFVFHRLRKQNVQYSDGYVFKFDDGSDWPKLDEKIVTCSDVKDIAARNIFTGEIIIFESAVQASEFTGVSSQSVINHSRDEKIIATNGYNFRFFDNNMSWPNHSEKHLKIYKRYPKVSPSGVDVVDDKNNSTEFYESAELAAEAYKLSKLTIGRYCINRLKFPGKTFSYLKLNENLGPPIE